MMSVSLDAKIDFLNYLNKNCNWKKIITFVNNIPTEFNQRERRFEKAKMIQDCLEMFSNDKLEFVGDVGFDFYVVDQDSKYYGNKIELKSSRHFFTRSGKYKLKKPTAHTNSIILNNSNGSSLGKTYEKTYDWLLLVDISGFAVTTWEDVLPYVKNTGAGFNGTLPMNSIQIKQVVDETNVKKVQVEIPDFFKSASLSTIKCVIKNARFI